MKLLFFNAKPHYNTKPVRDMMWGALPFPNDEMLDRLLLRYHDDEDMMLMGVLDEQENLLGILGLKMDGPGIATLLHLNTGEEAQVQRIDAALIKKAITKLHLTRLNARATESRVPFFTELGFTNWVIGEKPPGTKWYGVRWETQANGTGEPNA